MNNFIFQNPTKIYFGDNSIKYLESEMKKYGKNILLAYGGGSIKKNELYDYVINVLNKLEKKVFEIANIMPNPRTSKVYEGIEIIKKNDIDFILAVGGGSVIDCAKAMAAGAKMDKDFWETLYIDKKPITSAIPVGSILTLAGTGSEMNTSSVITNWEKQIKTAYGSPHLFPKFSILNPKYTMSLPIEQVVYGSVDILSHLFEVYFSAPDTSNLSDDLSEAIMKNVITNLRAALNDLSNYEARSNLMWDATMAINGLVGLGKDQDWTSHQIEHALSAFYDIPHGAGLAIVHPNFMEYVYKNNPFKYAKFARNVFNVGHDLNDFDAAKLGIETLKKFLREINAPTTLKEVNIPKEMIKTIAETIKPRKTPYAYINQNDIINILNQSYE